MKSFKEKFDTDLLLLSLAEDFFNCPIVEAEDDSFKYYEKPPQFITMSTHALKDGKARNRIWWDDKNHLQDPDFTHFADECLDLLKDNKMAIKYPDFPAVERGEVCFADKNEWRGWVTSLRFSDEKKSKLDSFNIVTILDKDSGTMNVNDPLFRKRGKYEKPDFVLKLKKFDLQSVHKENSKSMKGELDSVVKELKELTDEYQYALMELEDEPDNAEIKKKIKKLKQQVDELSNRKTNLETKLKNIPVHEAYVVTEKASNRRLLIITI